MTDPNEELNEELSTDELKSVSGGINLPQRVSPSPFGSQQSSNPFTSDEPPVVPVQVRGESFDLDLRG